MCECHSFVIRPPIYLFSGIECNSGVALPNTHRHNLKQQPPPVGAPHPHYSTSPRASTSSVSSLLSRKHASSYPSPSSPTPAYVLERTTYATTALPASMASQVLLQRLGGAFWQAFTTQTDAGSPAWDVGKI